MNEQTILSSLNSLTNGGGIESIVPQLRSMMGGGVDTTSLNQMAFNKMPEDMKRLVTDKFDGKPSELLNWLGNFGMSASQLISSQPGAVKFREAMLASGTMAQENWIQSAVGRDTLAAGMLDMYDDTGWFDSSDRTKLALIQRSIAAESGQGIAAFEAALRSDQGTQNEIWEAMKDDPGNAGKILTSMIPENQRNASVAQLSVTGGFTVSAAQIETAGNKLDTLYETLSSDGQSALDTLNTDNALAMTIAALPAADQDRLIASWQQDPAKLVALQENVEANPSYLSMQIGALQAAPANAAQTLAQAPDAAQTAAMMRAIGLAGPSGSGASLFGGLEGILSNIGLSSEAIGNSTSYVGANVAGGRFAQQLEAWVKEFASSGEFTNAGHAYTYAGLMAHAENARPHIEYDEQGRPTDKSGNRVYTNEYGEIVGLVEGGQAPAKPIASPTIRTAGIKPPEPEPEY